MENNSQNQLLDDTQNKLYIINPYNLITPQRSKSSLVKYRVRTGLSKSKNKTDKLDSDSMIYSDYKSAKKTFMMMSSNSKASKLHSRSKSRLRSANKGYNNYSSTLRYSSDDPGMEGDNTNSKPSRFSSKKFSRVKLDSVEQRGREFARNSSSR